MQLGFNCLSRPGRHDLELSSCRSGPDTSGDAMLGLANRIHCGACRTRECISDCLVTTTSSLATSALLALPYELLEIIVSLVAPNDWNGWSQMDDRRDLRALSETCRQLRDICEPYQKYWLDITSVRVKNLASCALADPSLGKRIKVFCIEARAYEYCGILPVISGDPLYAWWQEHGNHVQLQSNNYAILILLLSQLTNLEYLKVDMKHAVFLSDCGFLWHAIHKLQFSQTGLMYLKQVAIAGIGEDYPIAALLELPNLHALSLDDVELGAVYCDGLVCRAHMLELNFTTKTYYCFDLLATFKNLVVLKITSAARTRPSRLDLEHHCKTLECLQVLPQYRWYITLQPLCEFLNLKVIDISVQLLVDYLPTADVDHVWYRRLPSSLTALGLYGGQKSADDDDDDVRFVASAEFCRTILHMVDELMEDVEGRFLNLHRIRLTNIVDSCGARESFTAQCQRFAWNVRPRHEHSSWDEFDAFKGSKPTNWGDLTAQYSSRYESKAYARYLHETAASICPTNVNCP